MTAAVPAGLPGLLDSVPMLASVDEASRARLAERAERVTLTAGDWLFHAGAPADAMYLVASGRIEIVLEEPQEVIVRELAVGDSLGELALITGQPRSASVRARRDAVLVRISAEDFAAVMDEGEVAAELLRYLAGQLQRSRRLDDSSKRTPTAVALVPLAPELPVDAVADAIVAELRRVRPAELLRPAPGEGCPEPAEVLDRMEQEGGQLVMIADDAAGEGDWSARCLRQADAVVLLGGAGAPPPAMATALANERLEVHLMLPGAVLDDMPAAAAWLDAAGGATVTRADDPAAGAAAVGRRLAGRSVGVVLSGGGARGFAHLGVLAELLDQGILIDRVGGVSMGAVVGGLFATGRHPDELVEPLRRAFVEGKPLGDYTLPIYAFVRGGNARREFTRLFGDRQIEAQPREFFCASCDIFASQLVVHRRGSMLISIGSSAALPGIAPPIIDSSGRVLVDGGVLNNLPVEEMARSGHGPVIAIDVTAIERERELPPPRFRRPRLRRCASLARRVVTAIDGPLPSGSETIFRSIVLGSEDTVAAARKHAILTISPEVQDMGITDFAAYEEIVERGRIAAREALAGAPAELWPARG